MGIDLITTPPQYNNVGLLYYGLQLNGAMEVNQELVGTSVSITTFRVLVDQFSLAQNGTTTTGQQVTDAPRGFKYSIQSTTTGTVPTPAIGNYLYFRTAIEGYRTSRLNWGSGGLGVPVTITFWIKANVVGTFSVCVWTNVIGRAYVTTATINQVNTWEYKVVTIPPDLAGSWPRGANVGFEIHWTFMVGSTNSTSTLNTWQANTRWAYTSQTNFLAATNFTVNLTGVHIIPGAQYPTAEQSPFLQRPFDEELIACMRFWEKSADYATPSPPPANAPGMCTYISRLTGPLGYYIQYKVIKRTSPTITCYSWANAGVSGMVYNTSVGDVAASTNTPSVQGFGVGASVSAGQHCLWHWHATARM